MGPWLEGAEKVVQCRLLFTPGNTVSWGLRQHTVYCLYQEFWSVSGFPSSLWNGIRTAQGLPGIDQVPPSNPLNRNGLLLSISKRKLREVDRSPAHGWALESSSLTFLHEVSTPESIGWLSTIQSTCFLSCIGINHCFSRCTSAKATDLQSTGHEIHNLWMYSGVVTLQVKWTLLAYTFLFPVSRFLELTLWSPAG